MNADLDGANVFQRFFKITLPMIGPTFQVVLLNAIVGSMKMADIVLSTTNGQPEENRSCNDLCV